MSEPFMDLKTTNGKAKSLSRTEIKLLQERFREEIAEAFADLLKTNKLLSGQPIKCLELGFLQGRSAVSNKKNNRSSSRSSKSSRAYFYGSDAVSTILVVLEGMLEKNDQDQKLQDQENEPKEGHDSLRKILQITSSQPTRLDALRIGQEIARDFDFFRHVHHQGQKPTDITQLLQDSRRDMYQFRNNLPSRVRAVKERYPDDWDKLRLLEKNVVTKTHRYMLRTFSDCFVASEAVDVIVQLQLVKSRGEAAHLMQKLNRRVFACEHVCWEHDFEDKYLFFRWIPKDERMPASSETLPQGVPESISTIAASKGISSKSSKSSSQSSSQSSNSNNKKERTSSSKKRCEISPTTTKTAKAERGRMPDESAMMDTTMMTSKMSLMTPNTVESKASDVATPTTTKTSGSGNSKANSGSGTSLYSSDPKMQAKRIRQGLDDRRRLVCSGNGTGSGRGSVRGRGGREGSD